MKIFLRIIFLVLIVILLSIIIFLNKQNFFASTKIAWITDIHADEKEKIDGGRSGMLYSSLYEEYFSNFLEKMKNEGVEIVISTGDNTNDGENEYAKKLKEIEDKKDIKVLWTKGNHDRVNKKVMENLGVSAPYYYFYDFEKVRIIILNVTDEEERIDDKQMKWFEQVVSETSVPIIVSMHIPIINYEKKEVFEKFKELEEYISKSKKIKYVISGSLHNQEEFKLNNVWYKTGNAFLLEDHLGDYYIIEISAKEYILEKLKFISKKFF